MLVKREIIEVAASSSLALTVELYAPTDLGLVTLHMEVRTNDGELVSVHRVETDDIDGIARTQFDWRLTDQPDGDYRIAIHAFDENGLPLAHRMFVCRKRGDESLHAQLAQARETAAQMNKYMENHPNLASSDYGSRYQALVTFLLARADTLADTDRHSAYDFASRVLPVWDRFRARVTFSAPQEPEGQASDGTRTPALFGERLSGYSLGLIESNDAPGATGLPFPLRYRETGENYDAGVWFYRGSNSTTDLAVNVATQPRLTFAEEEFRTAFRDYVRTLYEGDRLALNRDWRRRFFDFDEIGVWPDYDQPAYRYDLHEYTRWQTRAWLENRVQQVTASTGHPAGVVVTEDLLESGDTLYGFSPVDAADVGHVAGVRVTASPDDPIYGFAMHRRMLLVTLLRSFDPELPIFLHDIPDISPAQAYARNLRNDVYAVAWEAVMAGADAMLLRDGNATNLPASYLDYPDALEGFVAASLDIERLASTIDLFRNAPATVGILWSEPSRIHQLGTVFLNSVVDAFEGALSAGYRLRFVSEEAAAANGLDGLEILILPELPSVSDATFGAVTRFVENGGAVIRGEQNMPFTERGIFRPDTIVYSSRLYIVRAGEDPSEFLEGLDALRSLPGVSKTPRAVNEFGFPLEGVTTRHVERDGTQYLYVINRRRGAVLCHLDDATASSGTNLITGRSFEFPATLNPLELVLIQLDEARYSPELTD